MSTTAETLDRLRWWQNTVQPHKSASLVDTFAGPTELGTMRISLHRGNASQGYKTDYERVETWWVTNQVTPTGHNRYFERGTRYSGKNAAAKARADYDDAVLAVKDAGKGLTPR